MKTPTQNSIQQSNDSLLRQAKIQFAKLGFIISTLESTEDEHYLNAYNQSFIQGAKTQTTGAKRGRKPGSKNKPKTNGAIAPAQAQGQTVEQVAATQQTISERRSQAQKDAWARRRAAQGQAQPAQTQPAA